MPPPHVACSDVCATRRYLPLSSSLLPCVVCGLPVSGMSMLSQLPCFPICRHSNCAALGVFVAACRPTRLQKLCWHAAAGVFTAHQPHWEMRVVGDANVDSGTNCRNT